ncbi:MAG: type IV pilin protein [Magnetococcales bacterium]|nr:type IV pilin protein [Magnetococcales bacterium]
MNRQALHGKKPIRSETRIMKKSKQRGFTLVELLIVLAIIAILAGIVFPSYKASVIKGRRADGKALLMQVANLQERWFTENMTYTSNMASLGLANPQTSEGGYYSVTILSSTAAAAVLNTACPITTCFVAEATPRNAQVLDGKLALASTGAMYHDVNNNNSYADAGDNKWE